MDDIYTLKQKASDLRKQKSYNEAADIFKILWDDHPESCNEWDGWGYAFSLRKLGDVENAYQVSQQVYEKWPEFEMNKGLLAWCIYDLEINKDIEIIQQNESDYFGAVNKILELAKQDKFSPVSRTIFKVIEYLEDSRVNFPAEAVNNWLDRLNPGELSLETWQGKDQRGRPMEHASDREKWYSKKIKALHGLGRYQECIDTGMEALKVIQTFHYRNDKWIKRLIALSYAALDNPDEGLVWLKQVMDERAEWFLYFDMALLLEKTGDANAALKYASQAALDRQDIGFRCNVFAEMGRILFDKGELNLAEKHILLAAKTRVEKDWSIPDDLQHLIDEVNVDISESVSARDLERELKKYWQSLRFADLKHATGTIKNIVRSGKSGFIIGSDNQEYYFPVRNFQGHPDQLQPGVRVSFQIQPSEQPGKLDIALNIKIQN